MDDGCIVDEEEEEKLLKTKKEKYFPLFKVSTGGKKLFLSFDTYDDSIARSLVGATLEFICLPGQFFHSRRSKIYDLI